MLLQMEVPLSCIQAYVYKKEDGGSRNVLASEACDDWLRRAVSGQWSTKNRWRRTGNLKELLNALFSDYSHHKYWEKKYKTWGGHRNGYAEFIHREAKDSFGKVIETVKDELIRRGEWTG